MTVSEPAMHTVAQDTILKQTLTLTPGMRKIVLHAQLQLRKNFAWYRSLSEDNLQRVNVMIEHALGQFNAWLQVYKRNPDHAPTPETTRIFVLAPLKLTEQITLQQTLELTRFFVQLLEEHVSGFATPGTEQLTRDAVALYAKEIAFSAASVYARAADPAPSDERIHDVSYHHATALAILLDYCSSLVQSVSQSTHAAQSGTQYLHLTQTAINQITTDQLTTNQSHIDQSATNQSTTNQSATDQSGIVQDSAQTSVRGDTQTPTQANTNAHTATHTAAHNDDVSRETLIHTPVAEVLHQLGWDISVPATALIGSITHPQSITDMRHTIEHAGGQCIVANLHDAMKIDPTLHYPDYLSIPEIVQHDPSLTICIVGAHEDTLVTLSQQILPYFDSTSVCVGSTGTDTAIAQSLCEVLSTVRALPALITPERIVYAHTLLPERALLGDPLAKQQLIETVLMPLLGNADSLNDLNHDSVAHTVAVFLRSGSSLETASQLLHVHPNTVRYRLKRSAELTGWDPLVARDAYVLLTAISLGLMQQQ